MIETYFMAYIDVLVSIVYVESV